MSYIFTCIIDRARSLMLNKRQRHTLLPILFVVLSECIFLVTFSLC